jgi:dUTP pyrophosphatase
MQEIAVKIKLLENFDKNFELPSYKTVGSAGADVRASLIPNNKLTIRPGERVLIPTGLSFEIPQGYEIQVRPRSGISFKTNLLIVNSPGTIDSDYRGELKIIIGNFGTKEETITHGDRIAQLIISPVIQAKYYISQQLKDTSRGMGGFGSTGVK